MNKKIQLKLAVVAALLMAGCATPGESTKMKHQSANASSENMLVINKSVTALDDKFNENRHRSELPWLGNAVLERSKGELPRAFLGKVTLTVSEKQIPLAVAASEITRVTGIPVRISADVELQSQEAGADATATATAATSAVGTLDATTYPAWGTTVDLNFVDVALSDMLDQISARMGISWEYRPKDGAIYFSRFVTRTFGLNILPGQTKQSASVGKSGGTEGFSATSSSGIDTNIDTWATIEAEIKSMMTAKGKIALSPSTQTVTVTDVKDTMEKVDVYIKRLNYSMTRQVYLKVDVVNVSLGKGSEFGVNWSLVKQTLMEATNNYQLNVNSMQAAAGATGSSVGVTVLNALNGTTNPYLGSQALMQALQSTGNTSVYDTRRIVTLNNQPTPVAVTNQVAYVQSVVPGAAATTNSPAVPPVPVMGMLTTGYLLNVYPTILSDNEVLIQFSVDISELINMKLVPSGTGINIEQPEISATQFLQRAKVRTGDTIVLSGYSRNRYRTNEQGALHSDQPALGGGFSGTTQKDELVIMITPVLSR